MVGRKLGAGTARSPGPVLGPHAVDGLIAGRLAPGVVELELAGLAA